MAHALLRNKVIAITGSSSRMGRVIAAECAKNGANLVIHHLGTPSTEKDAFNLQDDLTSFPQYSEGNGPVLFGGDLTAEGTADCLVQEAVSAFGRLDVPINNVAVCNFMPARSVTRSLLQHDLDVNFVSTYFLTQSVTNRLTHQGHGGSTVHVSSILGRLGSAHLTHYASSQAAIQGMIASFAAEFGKYGIRYNTILPGTINKSIEPGKRKVAAAKASLAHSIPLDRLGMPEDIAGAAVFLASDLSAYMTGQHLVVDGGASINYHPGD